MAATFMPLVGGSNIIEVLDSGASAMLPAKISGVVAEGRAGSLKTSFLIALSDPTEEDTNIEPGFSDLASFSLFGPYSHPVPSNPAATTFDYSSIIPVCRGSVITVDFVPTGVEWPASLNAYVNAALVNAPSVIYQIQVVPTVVNAISGSTQYGKYTFNVRGGVGSGLLANPLMLIEVDFSHSVPN